MLWAEAYCTTPDAPARFFLLCTGNCHGCYKWGSTNAYLEDDQGNPVYDWTIVDLPFGGDALAVTHHRIDQSHSNAYAEWVRQGKPMYPALGQRAAIEARGLRAAGATAESRPACGQSHIELYDAGA